MVAKGQRARRSKAGAKRKRNRVIVDLSDEQHAQLKAEAQEEALPVGTYVRQLIVKHLRSRRR